MVKRTLQVFRTKKKTLYVKTKKKTVLNGDLIIVFVSDFL